MRSNIHVRDKQSPVLSVLASTIGLLTTAVCDKNAREKTINFTLTVRFVGGIFKRASACDWDTYTTHIRSCSQQNSLTVELVDHTYDGLHVGAGRTLFIGLMCQSTVALYLDHFDFHFLCVCCTTLSFLQLCSSWEDFDRHCFTAGGSVAEWLACWVQIAAATLSGNSLRQTAHTRRASVH